MHVNALVLAAATAFISTSTASTLKPPTGGQGPFKLTTTGNSVFAGYWLVANAGGSYIHAVTQQNQGTAWKYDQPTGSVYASLDGKPYSLAVTGKHAKSQPNAPADLTYAGVKAGKTSGGAFQFNTQGRNDIQDKSFDDGELWVLCSEEKPLEDLVLYRTKDVTLDGSKECELVGLKAIFVG